MLASEPALKPKDAPALSAFDREDPFALDRQLAHEERMIRHGARAFAEDGLPPRVVDAHEHEVMDRGAWVGCFRLTEGGEADADRDRAGVKTRAEKTAGGHGLTGSKI